ncbi:biliverdin-producing heme oxygenase [Streptomyces sp. B6B3]|uniref:biliverdin-producing heme oxygenase n=1 Tax=Streptomyces sp. B6B3 TaxID=3153570 RepID=UPI00325DACBB
MTTALDATTTPFSALIRQASHELHDEVNGSAFMTELLAGRLGVAAFRHYTEQLWFVYRALEDVPRPLTEDPVAGPFVRPELMRTAALERDLDHLHALEDGDDDWRASATPLPATAGYVARLREVAGDWPGGYVAHHYTRYLGDLSGGQVVRGTAEKAWGLTRKGDGVRFYVFDLIGNPAAYKREYRARLDAVPVGADEKLRMVEECRHAFALNSAVLTELGAAAGALP